MSLWTPTDYANLKAAMVTGAKSVQFGSGDNAHRTEFRSIAEMQALLRLIEADLGIGRGSTTSFVEHTRD
jgi:hypothetical protein